jgi:hypothetical protein
MYPMSLMGLGTPLSARPSSEWKTPIEGPGGRRQADPGRLRGKVFYAGSRIGAATVCKLVPT